MDLSALHCPLCKSVLSQSDKSLQCINKHTYDIAREGYVNLLPVHKKSSLDPGDNAEMVKCRSRFLAKGHYIPLVNATEDMLLQKDRSTGFSILDLGCGEGYYTDAIHKSNTKDITIYGFDISKYAIKAAAKKSKNINYFVASVNDIPIKDKSIDLALSIFSPIHEKEISRVLKNDGLLLVVSAGPSHLKELALMIYDEFRPHTNTQSEKLNQSFLSIKQKSITFELDLKEKESITDLLQMTPYYWQATKDKMSRIMNLTSLKVTCDFHLELYSVR